MCANRRRRALARTVQTLHLRLFSGAALLQPFVLASLFAVEHESQHRDDVRHGHGHRQSDGLEHLKLTLILVSTAGMHGLL